MISFVPLAVFWVMWYFSSHSQALVQPPYQPCPLLRAYYPIPKLSESSEAIKSFSKNFTAIFDDLLRSGSSDDFGSITPNTTSFSIVLFSGTEDHAKDPIFYSYHHTASESKAKLPVALDTVFPLGTLTQLFTVYAWLIEMGDQHWMDPITNFIPELEPVSANNGALSIDWNNITVGSLAGHMAGVPRDSHACQLGKPCDREAFIKASASLSPIFQPDTTPIFSNAAFQLLSIALSNSKLRGGKGSEFSEILHNAIFQPLNMTSSGFLGEQKSSVFGEGVNLSAPGEQAALSMLSTTRDLARAGHAILTSRLISAAKTRRWLQPIADTSNLRNGVGRPWEIYHAGQSSIAPILDVFLKSGEVAQYSSYFGLTPDLEAGFAVLAHDAGGRGAADLNVYVDLISGALGSLQKMAAKQAAENFVGAYGNGKDIAVFNITGDGPGFLVEKLVIGGHDIRAEVANAARIQQADLDFRVYPTNIVKGRLHQFVAIFQDISAPIDAGTPTCITWMTVESLGLPCADRFIFELGDRGAAKAVWIPGRKISLNRVP